MSTPRDVIGEGRYLRLVRVRGWEWTERTNTTGVVAIVAATEADEIVLVEQWREPVQRAVIELPAGLAGDVDATEDLAAAACRELEEETGFRAGRMTPLTVGPISAGLTDETVAFFRALDVTRVGSGGGDASEDITVHLVPLATAGAWLEARAADGLLVDPKVYAGLYFLRD